MPSYDQLLVLLLVVNGAWACVACWAGWFFYRRGRHDALTGADEAAYQAMVDEYCAYYERVTAERARSRERWH